jgi:alkanesulfonate monooxygenase SsuD/methylene tetrahydromethanopterin reductase-like flavin-dependent oxidoreductase (luciferase family)
MAAVSGSRDRFRGMTLESIARDAEEMPWGTPDEVIARLIAAADHAGAGTVLVNMNRGAMPHEMFMEQIRRFGTEVLPALQAHRIDSVPLA